MKILKYTGKVKLLSGLHIGGGDDTMQIGGVNNSVIKQPNGGDPYIPGSSLKGKMRSLLEWDLGLVNLGRYDEETKKVKGEGEPFSSDFLHDPAFIENGKLEKNAENLLKVFGDGSSKNKHGITRISIGDCILDKGSQNKEKSESKYENVIDRRSGTAQHPRQTERVPAGVEFRFDIRLKIIDNDNELELKNMIERGLILISNDYLGGNGSRGYGRVEFIPDTKEWQEI